MVENLQLSFHMANILQGDAQSIELFARHDVTLSPRERGQLLHQLTLLGD